MNLEPHHVIRFITFCILFSPCIAFSQQLIGKSKEDVRKELRSYIARNDTLEIVMTETEATISLSIRGKSISKTEFHYTFDRLGKCTMQETKAFCQPCLDK